MSACSLLSGGKDSIYALHRALQEGAEVACVVSIRPARRDSWMFHRPLVELVRLQAEAMGLADRFYEIEVSGVKEREVEELVQALRAVKSSIGFDMLTIGGIASRYQYERFSAIARELGIRLYDPQWGADPEDYMRELVRYGIVYIITQITTQGLDPKLIGVPITELGQVEAIVRAARRYGFHPAFEGGEAETFVLRAPLFRRSICLEGHRVKVMEFDWFLEVSSASLCDRPTTIIDGVRYATGLAHA